ncbi:tetratricopeptide repeat protein [Actinomadura viridis]|uniref:Zn-dependent protease n=1 Tax=Actinomadura viridis TaxID=58110 RepID=A0A931DNR7_9ACTN|nr:tetratricopeptide repeat protein [Actinomadura viridis]MBG6090971.1 putative Zn-dependent protease [Actinomadura viridis]
MMEQRYETYERARLFFELRDPAEAARILEPLAEEQPGNRTVIELLGRAYFHSAQLSRAEETFRRLVDLDPCNAWAHEVLARTLERQSRPGEAEPFRKLALAMGGKTAY